MEENETHYHLNAGLPTNHEDSGTIVSRISQIISGDAATATAAAEKAAGAAPSDKKSASSRKQQRGGSGDNRHRHRRHRPSAEAGVSSTKIKEEEEQQTLNPPNKSPFQGEDDKDEEGEVDETDEHDDEAAMAADFRQDQLADKTMVLLWNKCLMHFGGRAQSFLSVCHSVWPNCPWMSAVIREWNNAVDGVIQYEPLSEASLEALNTYVRPQYVHVFVRQLTRPWLHSGHNNNSRRRRRRRGSNDRSNQSSSSSSAEISKDTMQYFWSEIPRSEHSLWCRFAEWVEAVSSSSTRRTSGGNTEAPPAAVAAGAGGPESALPPPPPPPPPPQAAAYSTTEYLEAFHRMRPVVASNVLSVELKNTTATVSEKKKDANDGAERKAAASHSFDREAFQRLIGQTRRLSRRYRRKMQFDAIPGTSEWMQLEKAAAAEKRRQEEQINRRAAYKFIDATTAESVWASAAAKETGEHGNGGSTKDKQRDDGGAAGGDVSWLASTMQQLLDGEIDAVDSDVPLMELGETSDDDDDEEEDEAAGGDDHEDYERRAQRTRATTAKRTPSQTTQTRTSMLEWNYDMTQEQFSFLRNVLLELDRVTQPGVHLLEIEDPEFFETRKLAQHPVMRASGMSRKIQIQRTGNPRFLDSMWPWIKEMVNLGNVNVVISACPQDLLKLIFKQSVQQSERMLEQDNMDDDVEEEGAQKGKLSWIKQFIGSGGVSKVTELGRTVAHQARNSDMDRLMNVLIKGDRDFSYTMRAMMQYFGEFAPDATSRDEFQSTMHSAMGSFGF